MTRKRLRLAGIVVAAAVIYTAFIAVMFEGNNSGLGILVMLGVSLFTAITLASGAAP